jgi:hypothetical protein
MEVEVSMTMAISRRAEWAVAARSVDRMRIAAHSGRLNRISRDPLAEKLQANRRLQRGNQRILLEGALVPEA